MGWFTKKVGGEYELGKTIGKGHFSKVKYAINTRTKQKVAIKVMERKALQDENMEEQVKREIAIMRKLNHPSITKLFDVFQTKRHVYLVLELVTGGELFDKIVECKKFNEETARKYFHQLVVGIAYCHRHGVAHRDLKPENLMLDEHGNLKISDFGLSNLQPTAEDGSITKQLTTMCGTPEYVAPEVLSGHYSGFTADVWSCGVILYVMLAGSLPFRESDGISVYKKIREARYEMKPYFTAGAKDLISKLLVVQPDQRLTLEDVMKHPWFLVDFDPKMLETLDGGLLQVDDHDIKNSITQFDDDDDEGETKESGKKEKESESSPSQPVSAAPVSSETFDMVDTIHRRASFAKTSFADRSTRFGISGVPENVLPKLVSVLKQVQAHPEVKAFTIKCVKETENGALSFSAVVSQCPVQPGVTVVEIRRGKGNIVDFNELYRKIIELLDPVPAGSKH